MIGNASFQRKIIYGVLIAILLIPISYISQPSSRATENRDAKSGGILARLRAEHRLSMAELGDIDPTSETMKLATLGMKGIAANLLWEQANKYKRQGDWENLAATLEQMSKLQPNFLSVWQFQAWNLSYNVSVEFDDFRSRYYWVKKGLNFMKEGIQHNNEEPVLYWEMGWMFGHKIGKADERLQYRRLYRNDEDFHRQLADMVVMDATIGADNKPDNWKTGRQWFLMGQELIDDKQIPIRGRLIDDTGRIKRGKNPVLFHSHPPKWMMNFAMAIEDEGLIGETAQEAWRAGGVEWAQEYGNREFGTTTGLRVRLNELEDLVEEQNALVIKLDKMLVGVRDRLMQEKRKDLDPEEIEALDTPEDQRTPQQNEIAVEAERKIRVQPKEIADEAPPHLRRDATKIGDALDVTQSKISSLVSFRDQVQFLYWKTRCEIEQRDEAIRARRYMFEVEDAYQKADIELMKEKYELAWDEWAKIFAKNPEMLLSGEAEEIYEECMRYKYVLDQLGEPWPEDFKLQPLVDYFNEVNPELFDEKDIRLPVPNEVKGDSDLETDESSNNSQEKTEESEKKSDANQSKGENADSAKTQSEHQPENSDNVQDPAAEEANRTKAENAIQSDDDSNPQDLEAQIPGDEADENVGNDEPPLADDAELESSIPD